PEEISTHVEQELAASLPPLRLELGKVELPGEVKADIRAFFARSHEQALQQYARDQEQWQSPDRPKWMEKPVKPEPVPEKSLEDLFAFVEGKTSRLDNRGQVSRGLVWVAGPQAEWFAPPKVHVIHVARLAYAFSSLQIHEGENYAWPQSLWWYNQQDLEAFRGRCPEPFGLRELDAAVASLPGGKPGMVAATYLAMNSRYQSFCDWGREAVWPAFAEHPEILNQMLGTSPNQRGNSATRDYWWSQKRQTAFKVLAMFPRLPPGFIPLLWDLALGDSKADRPLAQAALATVPDKASRIQVALQDGKQAVRAAAAEWLGKIG